MNWKTLLESVSESVNDQLRLRHDYLVAENRILRNQINGCVKLTDSERKELAEIGAQLGKQALAEIATVAQADSILAWHRKFANQTVDPSRPSKSVGRPRVAPEIEEWVLRMARENRSWGYDRIQGSLKHLGYTISDQTVGNILKRHSIPPAPERQKTVTWREFIRSYWDVFVATGFFESDIWSWVELMPSYLFCFIHFSRDQIYAVGMTLHQQLLRLCSFALSTLALSTHVHIWVRLVSQGSRSQAIRLSECIMESTVSAFASSDETSPGAADRGKVVLLSTVHHRPIRDGPIQRRQRFDGLLKYDERQAA